eukprot:COSAG05_NODE_2048_length_3640_cov_5.415619_1_plen_272_part_00
METEVENYGLSQATLEEIFLKIASNQDEAAGGDAADTAAIGPGSLSSLEEDLRARIKYVGKSQSCMVYRFALELGGRHPRGQRDRGSCDHPPLHRHADKTCARRAPRLQVTALRHLGELRRPACAHQMCRQISVMHGLQVPVGLLILGLLLLKYVSPSAQPKLEMTPSAQFAEELTPVPYNTSLGAIESGALRKHLDGEGLKKEAVYTAGVAVTGREFGVNYTDGIPCHIICPSLDPGAFADIIGSVETMHGSDSLTFFDNLMTDYLQMRE